MRKASHSDLSRLGWRQFAQAFAEGDALAAAQAVMREPELGRLRFPNGSTAMTMAAAQGLDFVQALGPLCDALGVDDEGCAPLMWAARMGDAPMTAMLLPWSNPHARDHQGMTALAWAMGSPLCVAQLLEASDVLAIDRDGWSLLHHAAARGDAPSLEMLAAQAARLGRDWGPEVWASAVDLAKSRGQEIARAMEELSVVAKERLALDAITVKAAPSAPRRV